MKRRLVIEEEYGLYVIAADGWESSGASIESALRKAWTKATQRFQSGRGGPTEGSALEVHNTFEMAEALDTLLGAPRERSDIHTGVLST